MTSNKLKNRSDTTPWPAPSISHPQTNTTTGPATILLGTGIPIASIEVRNLDETQLLANGEVDMNGRWALNFSVLLSAGTHLIKARQIFDGTPSLWTDELRFQVEPELGRDVPVINQPQEGGVSNESKFEGIALHNRGIVDIFNLNTFLWIANAPVGSDGHWATSASSPLPAGKHQITAIYRVDGKASDWARIRTFSIR